MYFGLFEKIISAITHTSHTDLMTIKTENVIYHIKRLFESVLLINNRLFCVWQHVAWTTT